MIFFKRTLPLIVAFTFGIVAIVLYFIPHQAAQTAFTQLVNWDRIIAAFALLIGIHSLVRMHWRKIEHKQAGWAYSAILIAALVLTLAIGLYNDGMWFWNKRESAGALPWIYDYVFKPAGATMFSVLAFFIASAAYRTFRARTVPAALLLTAAVITMLGQVPLGRLISHWFPDISLWLMMVPNAAVKRGILLGVALGVISTSLRIIFGIERAYLGGD